MKKFGTLRFFFFFLRKFDLTFNVNILINLKQKTNKHLRLTTKFNVNVEIVPRQPFGTSVNTLYTALNNVRADLFHFSANSLL
jgi:hypothetical protein